jgi:uncharacterized repeat protein (TIGR01451 family)
MSGLLKRGLLVIMFLLLCGNALAAIGITPAYIETDLRPDTRQDFKFNILFDYGHDADIFVDGDLANYSTLDKNHTTGTEAIVVSIEYPASANVTPGPHRLDITASQPQDEDSPGGFGISGSIAGYVRVRIPYPGYYGEATITSDVETANVGEPIQFAISFKNFGTEDASVLTNLEISNEQGVVETINLGNKFVPSTRTVRFKPKLSTKKYKQGVYNATAVFYFATETLRVSKQFKLGDLALIIGDYTKAFNKNKLNKFNVEVESFWNDPIDNVFANITLPNYNISFLTPSVRVEPWQKSTLTGFFDTSTITNESFNGIITVYFKTNSTSKTVTLGFKKEVNVMLYIIIGVGVLFLILLVLVIILFIKYRGISKGTRKK